MTSFLELICRDDCLARFLQPPKFCRSVDGRMADWCDDTCFRTLSTSYAKALQFPHTKSSAPFLVGYVPKSTTPEAVCVERDYYPVSRLSDLRIGLSGPELKF